MAKAITDIFGLSERLKDLMAFDRDDRGLIDKLLEEFSENIVVAAGKGDVALAIANIAESFIGDIGDCQEVVHKLLQDDEIDFDRILNEFRDVDWDGTGYSYETLEITILEILDSEECVELVQGVLNNV